MSCRCLFVYALWCQWELKDDSKGRDLDVSDMFDDIEGNRRREAWLLATDAELVGVGDDTATDPRLSL
jgi:hypothetical protein